MWRTTNKFAQGVPKFRGSGTGRVKNDEPSKPDNNTEFKVKIHEDAAARVKLEGQGTLALEKSPLQPWEKDQGIPANGAKKQGQTVRGRSSLWWKVRQIQERSKEARPNQQARQTHGRCIQGVKVDCYNTMRWIVATSWSWKGGKKKSLEDHLKSCTVQPFPLESTSTVLG